MSTGPRTKQVIWLGVGAGLLALAGMMQRPLRSQSQRFELVPKGNIVARDHPEAALLTMAPGGLRALLINFLWIRSQQYHQDGRHFDAMQLAELICRMQKHFPGVWKFHAWNMAWNISSTTRTPEERWRWVYNGVRLLRDEGIPLNPTSIELYNELAYIFYEKMGGFMDEMHMAYKQRWASKMQRLLASPPYGTTAEVIEVFRPIAQAPLDKTPSRRGLKDRQDRVIMQADQLRLIIDPGAAGDDQEKAKYYEAKAAEYAGLLAAQGVKIDQGLLGAYNKYSLDDAVQLARPILWQAKPKSDRDKAVSALINDGKYAAARGKLLAFVRAQILWHEYKMDPQWMLHLMEKYNIPLDWRQPIAHGLYWMTYGIHATGHAETGEIVSLAVDRQILNSLKALTWNGRLAYMENPAKPDYPGIGWGADWRYISPAHRKHNEIIKLLVVIENLKRKPGEKPHTYKDSVLSEGHINYLAAAIEMLFVLRRTDQAQKYLDWIRDVYDPDGDEWELPLDEFVLRRITKGGAPIPQRARNQLTASLQMAMYYLAADDDEEYHRSVSYARRVYKAYYDSVPERMELPPLAVYAREELKKMLVAPQAAGFNLSFDARIRVYSRIGRYWPSQDVDRPGPQLLVYDIVARYLRRECDVRNIDFERAFPPPPYLKEYRLKQARRLRDSSP